MRISDWSSDVCSSDLRVDALLHFADADPRKLASLAGGDVVSLADQDARHRSSRNALENRPGRRRWTHPHSQRRQLLVLELDPATLPPRTDCGDPRFGALDGLGQIPGPFGAVPGKKECPSIPVTTGTDCRDNKWFARGSRKTTSITNRR